MKYLRHTFLLVLCSLFLLSACASVQTSKPVVTNSTQEEVKPADDEHPALDFYVKHDCWRSPFNPHEILQYWKALDIRPINESMVMAIAGNPKVDWNNDYKEGTLYTEMPAPEGELTSAVVFIFVKVGVSTIELAVFGYKDTNGISHIYIWSEADNCYILNPTDDQAACYNNSYLTTKPVDTTDR